MDLRLNVVEFNDALQGFRNGQGTGTAITKANLAQQMVFLDQEPWYTAFIDLHMTFDDMDQGWCLGILKGYGVGPWMLQLIKKVLGFGGARMQSRGMLWQIFPGPAGGHTRQPSFYKTLQYPSGCGDSGVSTPA